MVTNYQFTRRSIRMTYLFCVLIKPPALPRFRVHVIVPKYILRSDKSFDVEVLARSQNASCYSQKNVESEFVIGILTAKEFLAEYRLL